MEMMKLRFAFAHFVIVLLSLLPLSDENGVKAKCENLEWQKQNTKKNSVAKKSIKSSIGRLNPYKVIVADFKCTNHGIIRL
jgi:hypothetical protein